LKPDKLHKQIASQIETRILTDLKTGDKVRSTEEIANYYGVSDYTAWRAVDLLKEKGILKGERGKGVFVTSRAQHEIKGRKKEKLEDVLEKAAEEAEILELDISKKVMEMVEKVRKAK
jgi:DNA-binding transcriptional regulator YhcF (GntR family)